MRMKKMKNLLVMCSTACRLRWATTAMIQMQWKMVKVRMNGLGERWLSKVGR